MNYRISTISWGHWHLNIFLNWNLRSLSTYDNRKFFLNNKVCYKIYTKENSSKSEALEFFCSAGRQVIVIGDHYESGGRYYWPEGRTPKNLRVREKKLQIWRPCCLMSLEDLCQFNWV